MQPSNSYNKKLKHIQFINQKLTKKKFPLYVHKQPYNVQMYINICTHPHYPTTTTTTTTNLHPHVADKLKIVVPTRPLKRRLHLNTRDDQIFGFPLAKL